jgi:DnaJ-class molecular chaperone
MMTTSHAASGPCNLLIASRPSGALVFLDGKEAGKTPLQLFGLKPGTLQVKITLDGYQTWWGKKRLRPGFATLDAKLEKVRAAAPAPSTTPPPFTRPTDTSGLEDPAKPKVPKGIDVECPACKGRGGMIDIGCSKCRCRGLDLGKSCAKCGGSGRVVYHCYICIGSKVMTTSAGKQIECRLCKGKGTPLCLLCKGSGTLRRPNPERAKYPTQTCESCAGSGFETRRRCKRCQGKGRLPAMRTEGRGEDAREIETEITCWDCRGKGYGPPRCMRCTGRGYLGTGKYAEPCPSCTGTGYHYVACRRCRGFGWVRDPSRTRK